ncbi:MAG: F0F1 ATP synthase subunit epsilon [Patescibacteria group bacterium]|nr:F0F1 ATP synthase subunit epsilon [Patescibacteria group bacterium]MDE2015763.1 F0F1 ATP synthase subunit epsilon [Patescibacteria group bacterium]MDE2226820.1 F0F1 ATP synthase subunit epsilon [Patescibacteria group bacterium]
MKLGVYSLKKVLFRGEATSVNCNTLNGEVTILDNHEAMISILDKGTMTILDKNGKEYYIPISSGFLETRLNDTKLIVEEKQ